MPHLSETPSNQTVNTLTPAANVALERIIADHLGVTFPALAITAVLGGDVMIQRAWGHLKPEMRALPIRPETLFDLASVSKVFTTTAFLSLVSTRQVDLDTPLIEVVPEFGPSGPRSLDGGQDPHSKVQLPTPEMARGQTADPAQVTFWHLLTHTSGLAPWRDVYNAAGPVPVSPDQSDPVSQFNRWSNALHALCHYPFVGQPSENVVRYSDLGLMLLGVATSRLHGSPGDLAAVIEARICEPLALDRVTYNPLQHGYLQQDVVPTEDDLGWRGRRCWGEVHDENACGMGGVAGHAGLFGAARNVAALGQAWLTYDSCLNIEPSLMSTAIQEHAETDGMRRGLGWMLKAPKDASVGERYSDDAFGHTGFTGTSLWIDPQRSLVVVVLTNRVYASCEPLGIHTFRRAIHDVFAQAVDEF